MRTFEAGVLPASGSRARAILRSRRYLGAVLLHCAERARQQVSRAPRYNRANAKRRELELISRVSDTDLWIIAHAAEYRVPYMSHDRGACEVARALGVDVLTALEDD